MSSTLISILSIATAIATIFGAINSSSEHTEKPTFSSSSSSNADNNGNPYEGARIDDGALTPPTPTN